MGIDKNDELFEALVESYATLKGLDHRQARADIHRLSATTTFDPERLEEVLNCFLDKVRERNLWMAQTSEFGVENWTEYRKLHNYDAGDYIVVVFDVERLSFMEELASSHLFERLLKTSRSAGFTFVITSKDQYIVDSVIPSKQSTRPAIWNQLVRTQVRVGRRGGLQVAYICSWADITQLPDRTAETSTILLDDRCFDARP